MLSEKFELIRDAARFMKTAAERLETFAAGMENYHQDRTNEQTGVEVKPLKEVEIPLEKIRGFLADKSRAGYTAEIRAIIQSYGAERLSEIDPSNYRAVMKAAEGLEHE